MTKFLKTNEKIEKSIEILNNYGREIIIEIEYKQYKSCMWE